MKAEGPWTTVIIELVGPFDVTSKNHVYVILLTDVFTKWVVALPLHNLSATEVAKAVVSALFLYGPPQKMATDQAEEFVHQVKGSFVVENYVCIGGGGKPLMLR